MPIISSTPVIVSTSQIGNDVIVNADINANAAIAVSKLQALTASKVVLSDASGFLTGGTAPATAGGTGLASPTAKGLLRAQGASNMDLIAPGSANQILVSNGTDWEAGAAPLGISYKSHVTTVFTNLGAGIHDLISLSSIPALGANDSLLIRSCCGGTSGAATYNHHIFLAGQGISGQGTEAAELTYQEIWVVQKNATNAQDIMETMWKTNTLLYKQFFTATLDLSVPFIVKNAIETVGGTLSGQARYLEVYIYRG